MSDIKREGRPSNVSSATNPIRTRNSLPASSCLIKNSNHLKARTLALSFAGSVTVLKAGRKRYAARIRVNREIVVR